ncbi:hypothetical protein LMG28138_03281 [Pararobbsia alpina]|uniref:Pyrroline-5-carboxylate reductase catalytic N-terminal domain-containing protein n=2 Tax=Pararobbsia alpina TaxID=621374 RepID=A0A6S7CZI9_9BURK|nr:hypothetical protein LMG28138_03281 [Pararobbsia alpina]
MNISIIGAGNIGAVLALRLVERGHEVRIANSRGAETLGEIVRQTGAQAGNPKDIVRGADVIVVTIPLKNVRDLPSDLFAGVPDTVTFIDTCNYYPQQRDGRIAEIEQGLPESRWVEQQIKRPVIKAFNNIYAANLRDKGVPSGKAGRIALPVAGDNAAAKAIVIGLVNDLGFDGVDAGPLDESWKQQPGSPVYTSDFDAAGVRNGLNAASPQRTADWRAKA